MKDRKQGHRSNEKGAERWKDREDQEIKGTWKGIKMCHVLGPNTHNESGNYGSQSGT